VKLIIYSDFEGDIEMSSKRASVNPLAGFLKPQPQPQPQLQPLQQTAVAAHRKNSQGLSNLKKNSRQSPPEVPSNPKIIPQTPSRTEIENLIKYLKVWSRSDLEPTVLNTGRTGTLNRCHMCVLLSGSW